MAVEEYELLADGSSKCRRLPSTTIRSMRLCGIDFLQLCVCDGIAFEGMWWAAGNVGGVGHRCRRKDSRPINRARVEVGQLSVKLREVTQGRSVSFSSLLEPERCIWEGS